MPLVFGFHGAGRTNDQFRTADARTMGTDLEKRFVMVYLKAAGSGWVVNTDTARVNTAFDTMKSMYCIDQNRVFATGHSSGAQMITQMLCANDRRFRAVAPVASSVYCAKWNNPLPVLLIHGKNDSERASTSQDANGTQGPGALRQQQHVQSDDVALRRRGLLQRRHAGDAGLRFVFGLPGAADLVPAQRSELQQHEPRLAVLRQQGDVRLLPDVLTRDPHGSEPRDELAEQSSVS